MVGELERVEALERGKAEFSAYVPDQGVGLGLEPAAQHHDQSLLRRLFIGALRTDGDVPSTNNARPALRAAMDRVIERHLVDDSVTPAAIATAHGVSTRTVNRVFNATRQTVSEVARVRRLARARDELTKSDRPISVIAHRWGFSDTSHFSRTFKAHYGSSPTQHRCNAQIADDGRAAYGGARVQRSVAAVQRGDARGLDTGVIAAQG